MNKQWFEEPVQPVSYRTSVKFDHFLWILVLINIKILKVDIWCVYAVVLFLLDLIAHMNKLTRLESPEIDLVDVTHHNLNLPICTKIEVKIRIFDTQNSMIHSLNIQKYIKTMLLYDIMIIRNTCVDTWLILYDIFVYHMNK